MRSQGSGSVVRDRVTRALAYGRRVDRRLARVQGAYYLATGLWPLFSMRTFEAVTGPKTDRWLVRMVGLLAAAIGSSLLAGGDRIADRRLAVGSALAFGSVDTWYAARRTISPIYLADAVVELALVVGWLRSPPIRRRTDAPRDPAGLPQAGRGRRPRRRS
jgi:hypothetical protein